MSGDVIWNCRVIEHNDEPTVMTYSQVKALGYVEAAKRYCGTDAWDHVSWEDGDEAVIEVVEDGFVGEPKRVRVNAFTALEFSASDEDD